MAAPSITTIAATDKLSDSRSTINTNLANIAAFLDQHVKTTSTPTFAGLALGAGSITMSGSIGVTGTRITKGWFTDLEVTNSIAGSITGDSATCSGLAASATILATARAINGVDFNGSAAITVTAAAGTLTGDTLKSTILASSLTSVGTLLDLTVTNTITGGVSGNAGTVTNGVYTTNNVNVLADITSAGANIEDAVTKKHASGSDTTLGTIAGNIAFDTTARTIGGIANGNLLDKSAAEIINGAWKFERAAGTYSYVQIISRDDDTSHKSQLHFFKTQSDSTDVVSGDNIGSIMWRGMAGGSVSYDQAEIQVIATGAPSDYHLPTDMIFKTGSSSAYATERMRIDSAGGVTVAGLSGNAGYYVKVDANGKLYTEAS